MKLDQLNPFIRYAKSHVFYAHTKKDCICYDCRLFYVSLGEGTLFANGETYAVNANTVIFLPPKTHYRFSFTDPDSVNIYVLNFDLTDQFSRYSKSLGTANEETFDCEKVLNYELPKEFSDILVQNNGIHVRNYVAKCTDAFLQKDKYYRQTASANLKLALLATLCQQESENSDYQLVQSVIEYIRENYAQGELSNQTIADEFHYHPYHLSRIMKAHTQKTLHSYLIDYRLHMAKNYLVTTSLNVTAIAEKTGFTSYTYFIKIFREKMGQSPLQYRQTHKNIGF